MDIDPLLKEHLKKIGKMGGDAVLQKKGREHFSKLAKKRWAKAKAGLAKK